ncbi:MAG: hypothetical protein K2X43_02760 [Hyphomonadaceae bacterium]|nr:hypothetical protein [Hyphomonadaceae bacterium]
MDVSGIEWADRISEFVSWLIAIVDTTLAKFWGRLGELQARHPQLLSPQTFFGLLASGLAIWKWWEAREANLFKHFEAMIERNEAQLIKARSDLLDVMNRPGPGLLMRLPIFIEKALRLALTRRKWHPTSLFPLGQAIDRRLESTILRCDRKVSAHLGRLALFRQQIASARLMQGALAAGRAASSREEHKRQELNQDALDHFRAVLALPGHQEDLAALELIAHQLARLDQRSQSAANAYLAVIDALEGEPESPSRNLVLARAKRCLAILRYASAPGTANALLVQASTLLTQFGPPRDRDLLELAETVHLEAITRFRLGMGVMGPKRLSQAQGHYRDLLRSLQSRRRGLFQWMLQTRRFAGHRVAELRGRAKHGLDQVNHLIELTDRYPRTIMANLGRANGVPRHNRKPASSRQGC